MKARSLLAAVVLLAVNGALPAIAKKAGPPSVTHLPLWTVKGYPTPQFVPGLTASLLLTPGQQEQLAQAWQETMGSEAVAAAAQTMKLDPNAPDAQKEAARAVIDTASANLRQRIDATLTKDQKALIAWINGIYTEVGKGVGNEMEAEFAAAKGDKEAAARVQQQMQDKLQTAFLQKLKEILTPEQWAAMTKAAEEEKQAAEVDGNGKGGKFRLNPPPDGARGNAKGAKTAS
jgi:hypothetical protein